MIPGSWRTKEKGITKLMIGADGWVILGRDQC